jgi:2-amino-4-hydroxy-6-hydroxymethyldihydropteridine diphosphokinase/dihydropteroate synthase
MVILGLGTNCGDRLAHLRQALLALKKMPHLTIQQISPVYQSDALLPNDAPIHWNTPYLNFAIRCETLLNPYELLSLLKQTEQQLGRTAEKTWGPRVIDIDLLAWDDLIQYDSKLHIPHEHLHERPFALWPLADVAPHWIYPLPGRLKGKTATELATQWGRKNHSAPLNTQQIQQRVDTPQLMGIVNMTPDSFSQDGLVDDVTIALQHIHYLVASGADIIDIGAEATGPNAKLIDSKIEWLRLEPLLTQVMSERHDMIISPKISIDTRHAETAQRALALGVDWINDVSGLENGAMRKVMLDHSCDIVFMHHSGIPVDKTKTLPVHADVVSSVYKSAEKQLHELECLGISRDRLIFDVGIGYGKTAAQSLALIKHIDAFHSLGVRLLVGHSRKSCLALLTNQPSENRDVETIAVSHYLANKSVDYLRVHNVDANARALKTAAALL